MELQPPQRRPMYFACHHMKTIRQEKSTRETSQTMERLPGQMGEILHILLAGEGLGRAQRARSRLYNREQSAQHHITRQQWFRTTSISTTTNTTAGPVSLSNVNASTISATSDTTDEYCKNLPASSPTMNNLFSWATSMPRDPPTLHS